MSTKTNLTLDIIIFSAMLAVTNPHLTGNTIHEWLGVSLAAAIITHLLFHWKWLVNVTVTFFKNLFHQSRLNYVVNLLFFIAMTGSFFSGLLISKDVISTLGIQFNISGAWRMIHSLTSNVSVALLGMHVALHWNWIVTNTGRYILTPVRNLFQLPMPNVMAAQPVRINKEK